MNWLKHRVKVTVISDILFIIKYNNTIRLKIPPHIFLTHLLKFTTYLICLIYVYLILFKKKPVTNKFSKKNNKNTTDILFVFLLFIFAVPRSFHVPLPSEGG